MLRVTLNELWSHRRRLVGIVASIVLGVGFLAGALALGDTLSANFNRLFQTANAGTDVIVRAPATVGTGLNAPRPLVPLSVLAAIRAVPGVAAAEPSITGFGEILGSNGTAIGGNGPPRLAVAWIPDGLLNPYQVVEGKAPSTPDEVVINRGAARSGKLHVGSTTTVLTPAPVQVRVVGIATFAGTDGLGQATMVAFDLDGAEAHILGTAGKASAVMVRARPGGTQADLAARIQQVLPPALEATTGAAATQQTLTDISGTFLTALRTVLVVFAAIALLVATLTIANTFSIILAQRSRSSALLRAIGATRRQVLGSLLVEASCIGTVAAGAGLVAGLGIAGLLKGVFDSFGFALPAGGLVVTASTVAISLVAGVIVTLVAAVVPAVRASRVPPLAALRSAAAEQPGLSKVRTVAGSLLTAAGVLVVALGTRAPAGRVLSLVGLGAVLATVGAVLLAATVARPAARAVGGPLAAWRGIPGRLGLGNALRNPQRTAAAATALTVGVTIVTLFSVYAASVRTAMSTGVQRSFVGDLAVQSGSFGPGTLSPQLEAAIGRLPGVATATGLSVGTASIAGAAQQVTALDPARIGAVLDLQPVAGTIATLGAEGLGVSQHEATNRGWRVGTTLSVTLPDGTATRLAIRAVYASRDLVGDYVLPAALWSAHATQVVDSVIFVKAAAGTSLPSLEAAVTAASAAFGRPTVSDRAAFVRAAAQGVSFVLGIVYVLMALAIVIAVLGIANTLSLGIHERTRELGLLRAVGQTRRQVRTMIRVESAIVSTPGVLGGLALGTFLGWGLAEATDRAQGFAVFTIPVATLVATLVLGAVSSILAAIRPARRAARVPILGAIAAE